MSGDRLGDFVKAGHAAQVAIDKLTGRGDVVELATRKLRALVAADALAIGSQVGTLVALLNEAAAHREQRRHTNAATCEQLARAELGRLAAALDVHFRRFANDGQG